MEAVQEIINGVPIYSEKLKRNVFESAANVLKTYGYKYNPDTLEYVHQERNKARITLEELKKILNDPDAWLCHVLSNRYAFAE